MGLPFPSAEIEGAILSSANTRTSILTQTCQPDTFKDNDEGGHQDSSSGSIQIDGNLNKPLPNNNVFRLLVSACSRTIKESPVKVKQG